MNKNKKTDDKIFHDHIQNHFKDEHSNWKVVCKICNKTYDEIVKKEKYGNRSKNKQK